MTDLSRPTLPGALPDKRQVAASFSRAAASYDSVAALQRSVGQQLLARLPAAITPERWLDLGCGTGHFSRALGERFPASQGVALDIAEGMLQLVEGPDWLAAVETSWLYAGRAIARLRCGQPRLGGCDVGWARNYLLGGQRKGLLRPNGEPDRRCCHVSQ